MAALGENSVVGTKVKINMNIDLPGDNTLENTDWEVKVFVETSSKFYMLAKSACVKVNADNYLIPIDSAILGAGRYFATATVRIPDSAFSDGVRIEARTAYTGFTADPR